MLAVGGMARSGTTLLFHLLNSHPDIYLTYEMRVFVNVEQKQSRYRATLPSLFIKNPHLLGQPFISSSLFRFCYTLLTFVYWQRTVTFQRVRAMMRLFFPGNQLVGDKWPRYHHHLPKLVAYGDELKIVMITRDARDVVASFMGKLQGDWENLEWTHNVHTIDEIALRWQRAVQSIQKHQHLIHAIRYEDLVRNPLPVLRQLGVYLGVDDTLFDASIVKTTSIGKYKQSLTADDIRRIEELVGDTLQSLGYEV